MRVVIALAFVALLAGCATGEYLNYQPYRGSNPATIVVVRSDTLFVGSAGTFGLYIDGAHVAEFGPNEYAKFLVPPGEHIIRGDLDSVSVSTKPGQTVYCYMVIRSEKIRLLQVAPSRKESWGQFSHCSNARYGV